MCVPSAGLSNMMAVVAVLLLAAVVAVRGIDSKVPPKFVRAAYGLQKALYAEKFGYSLVPLPSHILSHLNKAKSPTSRVGRSRKAYRPRSRRRRRRRPHRLVKYRRLNGYGVPTYAKKYKHYIPERRPYRYKKRNRLRGPPRWYRDPMDFDYYEQDISDYDDYGPSDYDYDRSEYDRDFLNRHAELYNAGYNPGLPRGKIRENQTQNPDQSHQFEYFQEEGDRWEDFRIPLAPKRERDKPRWPPVPPWPSPKPLWSSSMKPFSAAISAPSRPVNLKQPTNHKTFNWDPKSSSYKVFDNSRPHSYEESYSEEFESRHRFANDPRRYRDPVGVTNRDPTKYFNYKRTDIGEPQTGVKNHDEDIGFGQEMEMVDDRFTGWTVS